MAGVFRAMTVTQVVLWRVGGSIARRIRPESSNAVSVLRTCRTSRRSGSWGRAGPRVVNA
ncbi:hypothetical protein CP979_00300 [Streptomyces filamentosus]|nr:hypothetical protein CP979_00300 [Streptomyces filamentosus]